MITKKLLISSILSSWLFIGCGGGSSDTATSASTGYFVDSAVVNADYDCIADNNYNKTTGADGSFTCTNMSQVRFRIGELILGEIHTLHEDKYVFPQDLVGVARDTGINDNKVVAMAQLLQSLDTDGNPENGITIAQNTKNLLVEIETQFNPVELNTYLESVSINPEYKRTSTQAKDHLNTTLQTITNNRDNTTQNIHDDTHGTTQDIHDDTHDTAQDIHDDTHDTAQDIHDDTQTHVPHM